jgi:hypothetical protein
LLHPETQGLIKSLHRQFEQIEELGYGVRKDVNSSIPGW